MMALFVCSMGCQPQETPGGGSGGGGGNPKPNPEPTLIDLSSGDRANCYIAAPKGIYSFYAKYKGNSNSTTESINPQSAKLLWNTGDSETGIITDVRFSNDSVYFKAVAAGNAVIAVYDNVDPIAEGANILWSWHIWVTSYTPDSDYDNYTIFDINLTLMDRNLGALSAEPNSIDALGLFYQWGRKDPFVGAVATYDDDASTYATTTGGSWTYSTSDTDINSIKEPQTFYKEWQGTTNLWTDDKTINDPCPPGWKVPKNLAEGSWSSLVPSSNEYGFNLSYDGTNQTWYPFTGYIDYDFQLRYVGERGFIWSSTYKNYQYADCFCKLLKNGISSDYTGHNRGVSVRCCKI